MEVLVLALPLTLACARHEPEEDRRAARGEGGQEGQEQGRGQGVVGQLDQVGHKLSITGIPHEFWGQ